ncbi:hypothetical protein APHAL10511_005995 [Amanita phalloides]|nr:hypothetical protein APHAL10511_005995 [Amanita phalloides]
MISAGPDLTTEDGVRDYLKGTIFASRDIATLGGGTGNFAYRAKLDESYSGKTTVIIKHAQPYIKDLKTVPFDLSRQTFEVEALKRVRQLIPGEAWVTIPEVYLFDEKAHVIIMEDCGEGSVPLKQFMREGRLTLSMGEKLGKALGEFIGKLHNWGKDRTVWEYFDANKQARELSAWAYYGRLYETLDPSQNADVPVLRDPQLEVSAQDLEVIKKVAQEMGNAIRTAHETLVMGDFWPGNIVLSGDEVKRVYVIDWELCKPGLAGVEIGQFCAEIGFVQHFHPEYSAAAGAVLWGFRTAYEEIAKPDGSVVEMANVHIGTHTVVIGTHVEWGGREATRAAVLAGAGRPSPTQLHLPPHFPFPLKITSLDISPSQYVARGSRLLSYSFVYLPNIPGAQPETRFGTWDSSIEGTLDTWKIKSGDVVSRRFATDRPVVVIMEPCKHGMQLGGLCVLCGKDMTNVDYTGFSDASRASIQMTHSAFGPTVSLEEAQRIERETAEHLIKSRKLSLIVDLDQTIVHATVDPTVSEWIAEGEEWEEQRASSSKQEGSEQESDQSGTPEADNCPNPNWEALKDVKKFKLGPESFGLPSAQVKRRNKAVENEGCMYYIKPRPGWKEFFEDVATKYEMHVYTMGTRAYAEQVCSAIDPEGKLFGGRLLSRDESGSLTQKSLRRLFPCDTSMVVIIDDRADVWEWSPNLIKVIPYDFFIGIGDINSSFLPKIEPLTAGSPAKAPPAAKPTSTSTAPPATDSAEDGQAETAVNAMLRQNTMELELQLEERPLAKRQTELLRTSEEPASGGPSHHLAEAGPKDTEVPNQSEGTQEHEEHKNEPERKALLKNDDHELERVSKLLGEVHQRFFVAYDARERRKKLAYDVTKIIPQLRSEVLAGVHVLFSSVIPLDTKPETTEIWRMAHMFGAKCSTELNSEVTHVVSAKRGTVKVDAARRRGNIKIVWLQWFMDSVALWRRQDETPYFLDEPSGSTGSAAAAASSPTTSSHQVSSEPEPDTDEWDAEPGERPGTLELNEIDWNDINDEVEAAMNESEDEEEVSSKKDMVASEDEWTDETNSVISESTTTAGLKRKRHRSVTPSEGGKSVNGNGEEEVMRLKEAITANELDSEMEEVMTRRHES